MATKSRLRNRFSSMRMDSGFLVESQDKRSRRTG